MEDPAHVYCQVDDSKVVCESRPPLGQNSKVDTQLALKKLEVNELSEVDDLNEDTPVSPTSINIAQLRRIPTPRSVTVFSRTCQRCQWESSSKAKVILTIAVAIFAILSIVFMALYVAERKYKACPTGKNTIAIPKCTSRVTEWKDCADLYKNGTRIDGVYRINPDGLGAFNVRCDMSTRGEGWTVIQRRFDGSVNFYLRWKNYKEGFGDVINGEFWLGLDKIHRLSKSGREALRIDLEDFNNETRYAIYSTFAVANGRGKYKLIVAGYSGNAGDSLIYHNGMKFTTKDADNDQASINCASNYKGAWWYRKCHYSNLNGQYLRGTHSSRGYGVIWHHWKGRFYSLKKTEMKIRPHSF